MWLRLGYAVVTRRLRAKLLKLRGLRGYAAFLMGVRVRVRTEQISPIRENHRNHRNPRNFNNLARNHGVTTA